MADVPEKSVQFAGAGQPSNAQTTPEPGQQGAGEQQAEQGNKYLTAEEAQRLFDDLFNRRAQSLSAKTENRVRKVIEAAQAKGFTMTEQQAEAALSVMDNERQQPQTQPQGAQPTNPPPQARTNAPAQATAQAQGPETRDVHPVIATATNMMAQAGVSIEQDDPESELIDKQTTDPVVFLSSIKAAIEAKQQRLSMAGDPARIPSLSGSGRPGNPVTQIKDPNELWKLARQKGK